MNNRVTSAIDWLGGSTIGSLWDALDHYAYGDGEAATIATSIILQSTSTADYIAQLNAVNTKLGKVSINQNSGFITYEKSFSWDQGYVLGRNEMHFHVTVNWTATPWQTINGQKKRTVSGTANVFLFTTDNWDFTLHENDSIWDSLKREIGPSIVANLYSDIFTGCIGAPFALSGAAVISNISFSKVQYE